MGTKFSGWQFQPDFRTVQGVLQKKLSFLMGRQVSLVGAGRTDAGVHARGQVAHVTLAGEDEAARLEGALPGLMPPDGALRSFVRRRLNTPQSTGDSPHMQRRTSSQL